MGVRPTVVPKSKKVDRQVAPAPSGEQIKTHIVPIALVRLGPAVDALTSRLELKNVFIPSGSHRLEERPCSTLVGTEKPLWLNCHTSEGAKICRHMTTVGTEP
jgi:hypothetical protein